MESQVLIATHNANFLAGVLASGQNVDIFRMNRSGDVTSYDRITSDATKQLSTSPVLSSQRVLEAIFYRGVIICEADADRSVYQTVAVRDLDNPEVLFVHAHNKQTIPHVAELLRGARIPFCAAVDLDALNSHDEFEKLIAIVSSSSDDTNAWLKLRDDIAAQVVGFDDKSVLADLTTSVMEFCKQLESNEHSLAGARGALNRLRKEATEWHQIKRKGIDGFPEVVRGSAEQVVSLCARNGLFLVPVGELEGWMDLGTRRKNEWIVLALRTLHATSSPPELRSFVRCMLSFLGANPMDPVIPE
jgi:OLD-like protein